MKRKCGFIASLALCFGSLTNVIAETPSYGGGLQNGVGNIGVYQ